MIAFVIPPRRPSRDRAAGGAGQCQGFVDGLHRDTEIIPLDGKAAGGGIAGISGVGFCDLPCGVINRMGWRSVGAAGGTAIIGECGGQFYSPQQNIACAVMMIAF